MASEVTVPEVEPSVAVATGSEPAASDESLEPEGKSLIEEVPTKAEAVSVGNEEVTEDKDKPNSQDDESQIDEVPTEAEAVSSKNEEVTEDSAEPETGEVENKEGTGDSTEDRAEPENGEAEDSDNATKITVDDIKTAPIDFRFPTTNQAKHCFTRYNEFHKCEKEKGEGNPECEKYARWYRSICPGEWIERWNEQRENGTFPGRY